MLIDLSAQLRSIVELGAARISGIGLAHQRVLVATLEPDLRLQVVLGARGVGKTTSLLQFARSRLRATEVAYLSLDDGYFAGSSLVEVIDELYRAGYRHLLLDEVHRYPDWSRHVKNAYDRYERLRLVVTGSSVSGLVAGDADLSRRAWHLSLEPLSWRESLAIRGEPAPPEFSLDDLTARGEDCARAVMEVVPSPIRSFAEYLRTGCFPHWLEDPDEGRYLHRVRQSAMTAIDVDVTPAANASAETSRKLKRLLTLIAAGVPYTPNVDTIARQLASSRNHVYHMLDLLERARLIRRLWAEGKTPKTLAKPEKIYLENPNLACALAVSDLGNLRECAFLLATQPLGNLIDGGEVWASKHADFVIDGIHFEVGGRGKRGGQLRGAEQGFRVLDGEEAAYGDVLPLWLFGCLR